jgi:uncharacterized protein (DUF983 family)
LGDPGDAPDSSASPDPPISTSMATRTRDRTRCPQCGERVMPLAAGCALCGADLDTARFDGGPSPLQQIGSWLSAIAFGPRVGLGTLVAVLVIAYLAMTYL